MSIIYEKLRNSVDFFKELSLHEIEGLIKISPKKSYPKDADIYKAGSLGNELYVVLAGEVRIIEKTDGFEFEDEILVSGDYFGVSSFVLRRPRAESAISNQDNTLIVAISSYQVTKNNSVAYRIYRNIAKGLSGKIRQKNLKFYGASSKKNNPMLKIKNIISEFNDRNQSFSGMNISGMKLLNKTFSLINFQNAALIHCQLEGVSINRSECRSSVWDAATLENVQLRSCDFHDTSFMASEFNGVVFNDCQFSDINLDKASFGIYHVELDD